MNKLRWIFVLPLAIQLLFSAELYQKVRINFSTHQQYESFIQAGYDLEGALIKKGCFIEWIASAEEIQALQVKGYDVELLIKDMSVFYKNRLTQTKDGGFASGSIGGNYSYEEVNGILDAYAANYPQIVSQKISIGQTYEGRELWAVKISDNPEIDEEEPEVLFTGMHHAREPQGMMAVLYFMNYLTENYGKAEDATYLVDNREMWFVPIVNPDGYVYNQSIEPNGGGMHRKNRFPNGCTGTGMGIDLNRNYGYMWGFDDSGSSGLACSGTYRGASAFSELETTHIKNFVTAHEFVNILNYHSYSNLVLYPYGYDYDVPLAGRDLEIFEQMAFDMADMNGYTPESSSALYLVNGSSDDWMYGDLGVYAFTIEIGSNDDGFWPSTDRIEPLAKENLGPNLYFAEAAGAMIRPEISMSSPTMLLNMGESRTCTLYVQNKGLNVSEDDAVIRLYTDTPVLTITPSEFYAPMLFRMSESVYSFTVSNSDQADFYGYPVPVIAELTYQGRSFKDTLTFIPGNGTSIASYNAENGLAPWTGNWQIGDDGYLSSHGYDVSPGGNYSDNNEYILTSESMILPAGGLNLLEFWAKWDIEAQWDWAQLEMSTDGGTNWQALRSDRMDPPSGYGMQTGGSYGYDGKSDGWVKEIIELPEGPVTAQFRFRLMSDEAVNGTGFIFDDFMIWNIALSQLTAGDLNRNGAVDDQDIELLRQHILRKTVLDARQLELADLNADQKINVLDLILLKRLLK